jgi:hypothetical protein
MQYVRTAAVHFYGSINRVGFFGANVVSSQPSPTQTTTGSTANSDATTATFTGGTGSTTYTVGDVVKILKEYGLLES